MIEQAAVAPVLRSDDDDGKSGFRLEFCSHRSRRQLLIVEGAQVITSNNGDTVLLELRSSRHDFEHDHLYLMHAEMVVGSTTWFGGGCTLLGVLTRFCWRTEGDITREMSSCPSGDGIYTPRSPLPDNSKASWDGKSYPMLRVEVSVTLRCGGSA